MTERRRFFEWLGRGSLLGLAGLPRAAAAEPDGPIPVTDTWDVSWTERVTGKHRAVFDSPQVSEGAALIRAVAWCDHNKEVYGTDRKDMSPVVVFRHQAIGLIMNDDFWSQYKLGKSQKIKDANGKWSEVNPVSAKSVTDERQKKYKLETFLADGGIVLACGWAFRGIVSMIRDKDKIEAAAADTRAKEMMIPGVIIQPNGIFGVLRAQEAGCNYIIAS